MIWSTDFLTSVPRPFNRERTVFSTHGTGNTGYPHVKERSQGNSTVAQWLGLSTFTATAQIQSSSGEDPSNLTVRKKKGSYLTPHTKLIQYEENVQKGLLWWFSSQDSTLPVQGSQIQSLVREDSTGCGETKPACCNH